MYCRAWMRYQRARDGGLLPMLCAALLVLIARELTRPFAATLGGLEREFADEWHGGIGSHQKRASSGQIVRLHFAEAGAVKRNGYRKIGVDNS